MKWRIGWAMGRPSVFITSLISILWLFLSSTWVVAENAVSLPIAEKMVQVPSSVRDNLGARQMMRGEPKLGSSLNQLLEIKRTKNLEAAKAFSERHKMVSEDSRIQVTINVAEGAMDAVWNAVEMAGGKCELHYRHLLQATVPIDALEALANRTDVKFLREPQRPAKMIGNETTEGSDAINAEAWHAAGYTGNGVRVAVIDVGFDGYTGLLGTDLPLSVNTYDWTGDGMGGDSHGTACSEILYDVAPGVSMDLHKIETGVEFGNAVDQAINDGVDIISMSLVWFLGGPGDGTGYYSDIVHLARSNGIMFVTAAGNNGDAAWTGTFFDSDGDGTHEWSHGQNVNFLGPGDGRGYIIPAGSEVEFSLQWNDWVTVDQDFDLYLVFWNGSQWTTVASSTGIQNGTPSQTPQEHIKIIAPFEGPYGAIIAKWDATRNVCLRLLANFSLDKRVSARSLVFPADSPDATAAAAIDAISYVLEPYSSRGPTLGPGGACSGGQLKPDIAGYANVSTTSYGFEGFNGTSAATPHVAGSAALVLDANPSYGPDQIESFLGTRAIDLGPPGKDSQFGFGQLYLGVPNRVPVKRAQINGQVLYNGLPICAMVLANGQHVFTNSGDGSFDLTVPLDVNDQITVFAFCSGLAPHKRIIYPYQCQGCVIELERSQQSEGMTIEFSEEAVQAGRVLLTGTVRYRGNPICAMVLANGQYAFTCSGDGSFTLNVPLDPNGQITLFGFCDGLPPYKYIF